MTDTGLVEAVTGTGYGATCGPDRATRTTWETESADERRNGDRAHDARSPVRSITQPAMALNSTTRQPITLELMRGSPHRRRKELVVRGLFLAAALLGLVISVAIVLALAGQAIRWLLAIDLRLWSEGWFPRADEFDLLTIFAGTL